MGGHFYLQIFNVKWMDKVEYTLGSLLLVLMCIGSQCMGVRTDLCNWAEERFAEECSARARARVRAPDSDVYKYFSFHYLRKNYQNTRLYERRKRKNNIQNGHNKMLRRFNIRKQWSCERIKITAQKRYRTNVTDASVAKPTKVQKKIFLLKFIVN